MNVPTHIAARALLAAGVLSLAVGLYYVRAQEPGFTYAGHTSGGGSIDLRIDSQASYRGAPWSSGTWALKNLVPGVDKFFNFGDIKPGDWGENTISLHNKGGKDPLWVCLTFYNLLNGENGENEPESLVDSTPDVGELTSTMEFFAWHDDGDNVFEVGEKPIFGTSTQTANPVLAGKTYAIADYGTGNPIPSGGSDYFGIYWCAGDLTVNVATATLTCNGASVGNEVQTDTMKVDVQLTAVSAKDEKKFMCSSVTPPKPPKPPHGEVCEDGGIHSTTTSSASTGGNHAGGGGTVITGDARATASSTNIVNTTVIQTNGSSSSSSSSSLGDVLRGILRTR